MSPTGSPSSDSSPTTATACCTPPTGSAATGSTRRTSSSASSSNARRWPAVERNPLGYAYRSLVRANIDRWRVLRRRPEVLLDPRDLPPLAAAVESTAVEEHLVVLAALRALPPRQRAIVVLRYLQDLSEADTAEALGITVGAVKSGASRALARLRAEHSIPLAEVHRGR